MDVVLITSLHLLRQIMKRNKEVTVFLTNFMT